MEVESREHWAFVTHNGQFMFNRVVMDGKNSAAHFQKTMQGVLKLMLYKKVLVYIDDGLVFGRNIPGLLAAIKEVFQQLRQYRIFLKPSKCELFAPHVFCGVDI